MAERSEMSKNRSKNSRYVGTAGEQQVPEATDEVMRVFDHFGVTGVDRATVEKYLAATVALVMASRQNLDEAEDALAGELADDAPLRGERDAARDDLREDVTDARDALQAIGGSAEVKRLGLNGPTPRVPDDLVVYARNFEKRCREHGGVLERVAMSVDLVDLADKVAPKIDTLEKHLDQLVREKREEQLARARRDDAAELDERVYRGVSYILYGHLLLGGRDELAERLRPTQRRVRGEEVIGPEDGEQPDDADQPVQPAEV